ncbi:AP2/B3-like transcriptional factor family protein isoform 2 [Theobroma cacao]|uniref:AP2/B3-like transcriptional factor family protein isoform 2 n=1 Tax=Theobroma cacao TaxID=3641 RepID=A0A061DGD2_THECC|nr:AP2/B3-like transcriptional factor family protein isoform 2 [Theobroma cacao]
MDQRVKKEAEEIHQRTMSFAGRRLKSTGEEDLTLAQLSHTPKLKPSSSGKKKKKKKKDKALTERKEKQKSQSESRIKHEVSGPGGKHMSSKKNKGAGDGKCTPEIKSPAMIRAEEVQSNLEPEFPSFAKSLVRSHVGSCFWMGLPGMFCKIHLPRKDTMIILEDESGHQFHVKYYSDKTGLSAGWRQFCSVHNLLEGDVLIFQLVEPTKFKVYIIRANDLTELDGALGLLNLDAHTKQSDAGKLLVWYLEYYACISDGLHYNRIFEKKKKEDAEIGITACKSTKRKRPKSLPLAVVQKKNKRSGLQTNLGQPAEQSENDSEEVGSEVLEGFKLSVPTIQFKDITSFENFSILVGDLVIDSELSEDIRNKYFKLCCSQNSFLHENIIQGINFKLIVGTISETVNIADAIRACKLTTSQDEFDSWDKTLKAFDLLGMNVGFLRTRLRRLVNLAFESEGAADARRYVEAKMERAQTEDEIRNLEAKLAELKDTCKTFGVEIESLQSQAETYELRFEEEVQASW